MPFGTSHKTHEDQSCIQVLIVLLHELPIVFLRLLAVTLKEPSPVIFLSGQYFPFTVVSGLSDVPVEYGRNLPIPRLSAALSYTSFLLLSIFEALPVTEGQNRKF